MSWDVYLNGEWVDTTWFNVDIPAWYVLHTLIKYDGMDPNITVKRKSK